MAVADVLGMTLRLKLVARVEPSIASIFDDGRRLSKLRLLLLDSSICAVSTPRIPTLLRNLRSSVHSAATKLFLQQVFTDGLPGRECFQSGATVWLLRLQDTDVRVSLHASTSADLKIAR